MWTNTSPNERTPSMGRQAYFSSGTALANARHLPAAPMNGSSRSWRTGEIFSCAGSADVNSAASRIVCIRIPRLYHSLWGVIPSVFRQNYAPILHSSFRGLSRRPDSRDTVTVAALQPEPRPDGHGSLREPLRGLLSLHVWRLVEEESDSSRPIELERLCQADAG